MELFGVPIDTWITWAPGILAVLSFLGVSLVYIKRKGHAFFVKGKQVIETFNDHSTFISQIASKLDLVLAEVTNNGGSSLKDVVHCIEHRLYVLEFTSLTVLDHDQVAVFKTNALGQCVWVNRAYARLFDQSREDLLKFGWLSSIVAEQRVAIEDEWVRSVRDQREVSTTYSIKTQSGEIIPVAAKAYPILGPNSAFLGYVGTVYRQPVNVSVNGN